MNICVYGAASDDIDSSYITAGERLGEAIARHGHGIVFGGGAHGMMGAVARGADRLNGKIIGISPRFFNVDGILYDRCTEMVYTEDMRSRKEMMESKADAFIVTPGGIGTYDEFFEILCLRQLKRHVKPILLYNINGYFDPLLEMLKITAKKGFMLASNLSLVISENVPEAIVERLEREVSHDTEDSTIYR